MSSNNLPQTLDERRQFVLSALRATGITAPWMSAFAASPDRFRDLLKAHRRMATLHIHPDVLEGDAPDTVALKTLATPYFAAIDALLALDDEELPNALRLFADGYGMPRVELLDKLQELLTERNAIKENAAREIDAAKRDFAERENAATETLRNLPTFYAGHLTDAATYKLPEGGTLIAVSDLRGQTVASPIVTNDYGETGRHVGVVTTDGDLKSVWRVGSATNEPDEIVGKVVALTNTELLDDGDVRDAMLPRGAMAGEITFPDLSVAKLVNGLTGRLRQTEKHNDKAKQTAPSADDYDIRRAVLVAVKADANDLFTLTLFPLAAIVAATPKD